MSLIWRYLRRYRWYCLTALLFVLIEANCELLLPTLMARMVDEGVRSGQIDRILELGGWMAGAAIGGIVCVLVRNLCSGTASQRFGADLRRGLFAKCLHLTEGGVDQVGSGSLVTRMSSDCDQLAKSVNSALRIGIKAPVLCVGSVCKRRSWPTHTVLFSASRRDTIPSSQVQQRSLAKGSVSCLQSPGLW